MQNGDKASPQNLFLAKPNDRFATCVSIMLNNTSMQNSIKIYHAVQELEAFY